MIDFRTESDSCEPACQTDRRCPAARQVHLFNLYEISVNSAQFRVIFVPPFRAIMNAMPFWKIAIKNSLISITKNYYVIYVISETSTIINPFWIYSRNKFLFSEIFSITPPPPALDDTSWETIDAPWVKLVE